MIITRGVRSLPVAIAIVYGTLIISQDRGRTERPKKGDGVGDIYETVRVYRTLATDLRRLTSYCLWYNKRKKRKALATINKNIYTVYSPIELGVEWGIPVW